jgi:hypothetical protein
VRSVPCALFPFFRPPANYSGSTRAVCAFLRLDPSCVGVLRGCFAMHPVARSLRAAAQSRRHSESPAHSPRNLVSRWRGWTRAETISRSHAPRIGHRERGSGTQGNSDEMQRNEFDHGCFPRRLASLTKRDRCSLAPNRVSRAVAPACEGVVCRCIWLHAAHIDPIQDRCRLDMPFAECLSGSSHPAEGNASQRRVRSNPGQRLRAKIPPRSGSPELEPHALRP